MTPQNVYINFAADSPRIEEQLMGQGLKLDMDPLNRHHLQCDLDQAKRLQNRRMITDAEAGNAFKRISRIIKLHAKPL